MKADLRQRLRAAAKHAWEGDFRHEYPPITDWSMLMEEAADAIDELEDDIIAFG